MCLDCEFSCCCFQSQEWAQSHINAVFSYIRWQIVDDLLADVELETNAEQNMDRKYLNHVPASSNRLMKERHTVWLAWEKGRGLGSVSIARGAQHPHLLAHGWTWLFERKRWRPKPPSPSSPLHAAGSLSEVMSHVSSSLLSASWPGDKWWSKGRRGWSEIEGKRKSAGWSSGRGQFLGSAPGRFLPFSVFCCLHLSPSPMALQG